MRQAQFLKFSLCNLLSYCVIGINLNLAPCLEINENLLNPLVNVRGYGATKEIVLKNASLFVEGIQSSGALSCIKHFPGAGSSTKDSHLELPIIEDSKEQLLNYNMKIIDFQYFLMQNL